MKFAGVKLEAYTVWAVFSSKPVADCEGCGVYVCLPIDLGADGLPIDDTRYLSLVLVGTGVSSVQLCAMLDDCGIFATKWLDVMTKRSW